MGGLRSEKMAGLRGLTAPPSTRASESLKTSKEFKIYRGLKV